jgi:hypothetical protein
MMIQLKLFVATLFYGLAIVWHTLDVFCERIANGICGVDQSTIDKIKERNKNEISNRD